MYRMSIPIFVIITMFIHVIVIVSVHLFKYLCNYGYLFGFILDFNDITY